MIEDITLSNALLDISGVDLTFPSYTIPPVLPAIEGTVVPARYLKALVGFTTDNLIDAIGIIIGTESQNFNFYTTTPLCHTNTLIENDLFNFADLTYTYNFKLASKPIPQTDGWSRLPAIFISKAVVSV